jgi:hypothetical protein
MKSKAEQLAAELYPKTLVNDSVHQNSIDVAYLQRAAFIAGYEAANKNIDINIDTVSMSELQAESVPITGHGSKGWLGYKTAEPQIQDPMTYAHSMAKKEMENFPSLPPAEQFSVTKWAVVDKTRIYDTEEQAKRERDEDFVNPEYFIVVKIIP